MRRTVAVLADTTAGAVTLALPSTRLSLTPDSARQLAARLLLLAEDAEQRDTLTDLHVDQSQ